MDLIYFFGKDKESREDLLEGLISDLRNQTRQVLPKLFKLLVLLIFQGHIL